MAISGEALTRSERVGQLLFISLIKCDLGYFFVTLLGCFVSSVFHDDARIGC